jgi:hypothetical protein
MHKTVIETAAFIADSYGIAWDVDWDSRVVEVSWVNPKGNPDQLFDHLCVLFQADGENDSAIVDQAIARAVGRAVAEIEKQRAA